MTTNLKTTPQLIGLAAAGAAALGLSLSDGLLQPMGRLATLRKSRRATTPVQAPAPAATPAPAPEPAPVHQPAAAGSSGMFDNLLD
ncbi:MAG: hypothetical protein IKZ07_03880 [Akkermansia sp.]|nr:hypothetical protein [Akkermansia sp.]